MFQAGGKIDFKNPKTLLNGTNGRFDTSKLEDDLMKLDQNFSANKLFDK